MHFTNISTNASFPFSSSSAASFFPPTTTSLSANAISDLIPGRLPESVSGPTTLSEIMVQMSQETPSSSEYPQLPLAYTVLEILVAIVAFFGNALVILVFWLDRRLRKTTNFYIISLSMADLLVGCLGIPTAILTRLGIPHHSTNLCIVMLCSLIILCTTSILNLVAVSLDRYWAILHPLDYHKRISGKTALLIICACWILGTVVGLIPLFGWNSSHLANGACLFIPIMTYDFLMFLYFATIIAPAVLMAFFYIRIYIVVVQQLSLHKIRHMNSTDLIVHSKSVPSNLSHYTSSSLNSGNSSSSSIGDGAIYRSRKLDTSDRNRSLSYSRREVKKAQKLFVIVVFFMFCWLPLYTSNTVNAFCETCRPSEFLLDFFIILSHANSAGSPFLYAFHLKDFRNALRRLICKGAINQRKLRDLRREEMFSISGRSRGLTVSPDLPSCATLYVPNSASIPGAETLSGGRSRGFQKSRRVKYTKCCNASSQVLASYGLDDVQEVTSSKEF